MKIILLTLLFAACGYIQSAEFNPQDTVESLRIAWLLGNCGTGFAAGAAMARGDTIKIGKGVKASALALGVNVTVGQLLATPGESAAAFYSCGALGLFFECYKKMKK